MSNNPSGIGRWSHRAHINRQVPPGIPTTLLKVCDQRPILKTYRKSSHFPTANWWAVAMRIWPLY